MEYVDPIVVSSIGALIVGVLLVVGGLWGKSQSKRNTRRSAEVLTGLAAVLGMVTIGAGALFLVQAV
jgi:hypothetical protein